MVTFIIGVLVFLFLMSRMSLLESKVDKLTKQVGSIGAINTKSAVSSADTPVASVTATVSHPPQVSHMSVPAQAPQVSQVSPIPQVSQVKKDGSEFAVGAKLLTTIGVIAFLLGITFFLRYAFENGLISETTRIVLGYLTGIILISIGFSIRKKYNTYATGLVGAGLGVFYVATFAGYAFYDFFPETIAFIGFIGITVLGVILSIVFDSFALILFAMLGGYIVPFLFPMVQSVHLYFIYLGILAGGVLIVARFKAWPKLGAVGLLATGLISMIWVYGSLAKTYETETFFYLSILFVIFCTTSFINFLVRDRDYKGVDAFLIYALPVGFSIVTQPLIQTKEGYALLSLILAFFYIGASLVLRNVFRGVGEILKASNIMLIIGSVYAIAATALYFDGNFMTIMLAAEVIFMMIAGVFFNAKSTRILGTLLSVIVGMVGAFNYVVNTSHLHPIFNRESFTILMVIFMYSIVWYVYHVHMSKMTQKIASEDEQNLGRYIGATGFIFLSWAWVILDAVYISRLDPGLFTPIAWSLFALIFTGIGFTAKEFIFRAVSYVIIGLAIIKLFANQIYNNVDLTPLFNLRFLSALIIALVMWCIIKMMHSNRDQLHGDPAQVFAGSYLIMNCLILWAGSFEISDYFRIKISSLVQGSDANDIAERINVLESTKRVTLSIFWLLYASTGLAYGILQKSSLVRKFAIILFSVTIVKIFIYDTANLSDVYRFISFITLGVILLLAGFAYYRFKGRITELV